MKTIALIWCCMIATTACGDDNSDVFFVNTATRSVEVVFAATDANSFVFFSTDSLDAVLVPNIDNRAAVAATVAAGSVAVYFTPGCATAVATNNTVTLTLVNCDGPLGLTNATGTVTITYDNIANSNDLHVSINASQLNVNNSVVNLMEQGTISSVNGVRTASLTSASTGTTSNGTVVDRTGSYMLTWMRAATCANLDGTFMAVTDGNIAVTHEVSAFSRCGAACPSGTIKTTASDSRSVTVTLSGTDVVRWASIGGGQNDTGSLTIACQ